MTAPARPLRHTALATAVAPVLDRPAAGRRAARPPLAVVPHGVRPGRRTARRASKAPFAMLLLLLMGGGLLGLLLLNTALTEDAFHLHKLQVESEALAEQEQELSLKVDEMSDPAALASRAAGFGMVPGSAPGYLPVGMPIPPGARVIGAEPGEPTVLVVLPAPAAPAAGPDASDGGPAASASSAGVDAPAEDTDAPAEDTDAPVGPAQ